MLVVLRRALAVVLLVTLSTCAWGAVDRDAFTFTRYELNATVVPDQSAMDVEGTIQLRNDSKVPQKDISLQVSSSFTWRQVTVGDREVEWLTQPYTSDIDHTGAMSEAIISLEKPLAAGESTTLHVHYSGTVPVDSTRLTRIGTPNEVAIRSDWDQIGRGFTAVRGLGYVTWYPVSMPAASLSSGDDVFDAIANWKHKNGAAKLHVTLTKQYYGEVTFPLFVTNAIEVGGIGGSIGGGNLGDKAPHTFGEEFTFDVSGTPTFVAGPLAEIDRQNMTVFATADHTSFARDYITAAEKSLNTTKEWFGEPKRKSVIVELVDPDALPFEVGPYLFTPMLASSQTILEVALTRTLVHASFDSPRPWVREGLAGFAQELVREQQQGRKAGLAYLNQFVNALELAEKQTHSTAEAGQSSSKPQVERLAPQTLIESNDELFYRTKASFVWSMLRDMLGDDAIKTFVSRYKAEQDLDTGYVQHLLENAATKRDLEDFFDGWVYRDRGLPDFSVESAYTREIISAKPNATPTYSTAITLQNLGDVWAEVPVVVRSGKDERSVRAAVPPHEKTVVRVPLLVKPDDVVVNDGSVPESNLDNNRAVLSGSEPK